MVRYPFDLLRAVSEVEPLAMIGTSVRPEVYPPSAAPEATRVSKDERRVNVPFIQVARQPVKADFLLS
jgi:hypothetical protein